jgi:flagella basal body P-ring formation protein FlgA
VDGRPAGLVRVDIEGTWTGQLLRARAALAHWTVPEAEQFEQVDFQGNPPPGALSGIPAGYRLRAPVGAGHLLAMQDLETIPVVSPGEDVRLDLVSGPLTITIAATARSGGAVGDKIRLEMPTSHKIVQAVVTGPDAARVQWAGGN